MPTKPLLLIENNNSRIKSVSASSLLQNVILWTPTHGHTNIGWPAKYYIHQLSYTWTHQYWLTSKILHSSALLHMGTPILADQQKLTFISSPTHGHTNIGWPAKTYIHQLSYTWTQQYWLTSKNLHSSALLHMDTPILADQQKLTFISSPTHGHNNIGWPAKTYIHQLSYTWTQQYWLTSKNLHSSALLHMDTTILADQQKLTYISSPTHGHNNIGWPAKTYIHQLSYTWTQQYWLTSKNLHSSALLHMDTTILADQQKLTYISSPTHGHNNIGWPAKTYIHQLSYTWTQQYWLTSKNLHSSALLHMDTTILADQQKLTFISSPTHGHNNIGWPAKTYIHQLSYTWTHQYWLTSKILHSSALLHMDTPILADQQNITFISSPTHGHTNIGWPAKTYIHQLSYTWTRQYWLTSKNLHSSALLHMDTPILADQQNITFISSPTHGHTNIGWPAQNLHSSALLHMDTTILADQQKLTFISSPTHGHNNIGWPAKTYIHQLSYTWTQQYWLTSKNLHSSALLHMDTPILAVSKNLHSSALLHMDTTILADQQKLTFISSPTHGHNNIGWPAKTYIHQLSYTWTQQYWLTSKNLHSSALLHMDTTILADQQKLTFISSPTHGHNNIGWPAKTYIHQLSYTWTQQYWLTSKNLHSSALLHMDTTILADQQKLTFIKLSYTWTHQYWLSAKTYIHQLSYTWTQQYWLTSKNLHSSALLHMDTTILADQQKLTFISSPTHGHNNIGWPAKTYIHQLSYTWTQQYWLTSKNLHSSALLHMDTTILADQQKLTYISSPTHGHNNIGWPAKTYIHQLFANTLWLIGTDGENDRKESVLLTHHDDYDNDEIFFLV